MPELPEVETIRIGLENLLPGKIIKDVWHDWPKSFPNAPADVDKFMIGAKICAVRRRAKVLIIDLSSNYSLIIHLKMTGQLIFVPQAQKKVTGYSGQVTDLEKKFGGGHPNKDLVNDLPTNATRVIIEFYSEEESRVLHLDTTQGKAEQRTEVYEDYSEGVEEALTKRRVKSVIRVSGSAIEQDDVVHGPRLFFNDQRKFGWMRLLPTIEIPEINFFKTVGPEPLEDDFTAKLFIGRLMRRKNSGIKSVLLDQTVIAGIGNIYADESLWLAKIHPLTPVFEISKVKLGLLRRSIREILSLSIKLGGSTDKNYIDARGQKGSYLKFAQVFRQEGQPCPRCGTEITKIRVASRGTHICPKCQKQ